MKEAVRRYLVGLHLFLCLGTLLTLAGCLALHWTFRAPWLRLTGLEALVGLHLVGAVPLGLAALAMLLGTGRNVGRSETPWRAVYSSSLLFLLAQALCLGSMAAFPAAWPFKPPEPEPVARVSATPSATPSPVASSSPPMESVCLQDGQVVAEAVGGRLLFFDGLTLTVQQEVTLDRPVHPGASVCREGQLLWADGARITSVSLDFGTTRYQHEAAGELVGSMPGMVFLRDGQGRIHAHDIEGGQLCWDVAGPLVVEGKKVYRLSDTLTELDPASGRPIGNPIKLVARLDHPVFDSGTVVGTKPGTRRLAVLDGKTGKKLWSPSLEGDYRVGGGRLYLSVAGGVRVYDLRTGEARAGGEVLPGVLVEEFSSSIVTRASGMVTAYDPVSGAILWRRAEVEAWPLVGLEGILMRDDSHQLEALDPLGNEIFKGPLDPAVTVLGVMAAQDNQVVLLVSRPGN